MRVLDQALLLDDSLHLQCRHGVERVALVRLAVLERRGARAHSLDDPLVQQQCRDSPVPGGQPLAHGEDVRDDVVVLPGVHRARAAHAAHDFVEDDERAVAVADVFHGLEVAGQGDDAAESLEDCVSGDVPGGNQ